MDRCTFLDDGHLPRDDEIPRLTNPSLVFLIDTSREALAVFNEDGATFLPTPISDIHRVIVVAETHKNRGIALKFNTARCRPLFPVAD